jgi:hypothetical protein
MNLDKISSLFKVKAIEGGNKAKIFKRRLLIFNGKLEFLANDIVDFIGGEWIWAGKGKVINLAATKDGFRAKVVRNVNNF